MKQPGKDPAIIGETRINQEAIGARLRQLFDEVVNEPVPDEFLALLSQADNHATPVDRDPDADQ